DKFNKSYIIASDLKKNIMIKNIKILSMAFLVAMSFASCSKSNAEETPEIIEGDVISISTPTVITTETGLNGFNYQIGIDAIEDGKRIETHKIVVDAGTFISCLEIMKGVPQSQFARFQAYNDPQGSTYYVLKEQALMNYDVMGTPPVYIFSSDQKIITN
ncbi:MAG: hypothetical protein KBD22_01975, partial [Candidatus Pacebacteria bacterium]|nr:hypothetical protein [Candidatus Paceibacterota bacterium]